jgi:hypothetical protein
MCGYDDVTSSTICLCSIPFPLIPPYLGWSVDIMVAMGGINLYV